MTTHRYSASIRWTGSTGLGWERYDRAHTAEAPPAGTRVTLTTGEPHGDHTQLNPEQLLVMAASSCQLLMFLHLAAKARIDVVEYRDEAEALMPEHDPPTRITSIALRPAIVVRPAEGAKPPSRERIERLCQLAHRECYIANSLSAKVTVTPRLELAGRAAQA
ncbi:MAG TPA: OsmC family protein [Longimicrobiales bacterium]|nr:OsmC family protein [Longimicrobiales bacterium]